MKGQSKEGRKEKKGKNERQMCRWMKRLKRPKEVKKDWNMDVKKVKWMDK